MSSISEWEGKWTQYNAWLQYPNGVECFVVILIATVFTVLHAGVTC